MSDSKVLILNKIIAEKIQLPINVYGFLDWSTGVVRINMSGEEYKDYDNQPDWFKREFTETINHEIFHSIQISTCGYLYNYVSNITADFWIDYIDNKENFEKLINQKDVEINDKLLKKLNLLNIKNSNNGLSIIDIIESHTFLIQHLITDPVIQPNDYERKLYGLKNSIYSNAYFYLEYYIGEKAFYALPAISYISLCFGEPTKVFELLSKGLQKRKEEISFESIENILDEVIENSLTEDELKYFLGSPIKLIGLDKPLIPFYEHTIKKINENYSINEIGSLMSNPFLMSDNFLDLNLRPIMFNTAEIVIPNDYENTIFDTKDILEQAFVFFTYLSHIALNELGNGPNYLMNKSS